MTSYAPVSEPWYILRKHSSTWTAFLWDLHTKPMRAQRLPARQTPLLCLGLAEMLPTSTVSGTYLLALKLWALSDPSSRED